MTERPFTIEVLGLFWYALGVLMLLLGIFFWLVIAYRVASGREYFLLTMFSIFLALLTFLILGCTGEFIRGSKQCAKALVYVATFITLLFSFFYFCYLFEVSKFAYSFTSKEPHADIINNAIYFSSIYIGVMVIVSHQVREVKVYLQRKGE